MWGCKLSSVLAPAALGKGRTPHARQPPSLGPPEACVGGGGGGQFSQVEGTRQSGGGDRCRLSVPQRRELPDPGGVRKGGSSREGKAPFFPSLGSLCAAGAKGVQSPPRGRSLDEEGRKSTSPPSPSFYLEKATLNWAQHPFSASLGSTGSFAKRVATPKPAPHHSLPATPRRGLCPASGWLRASEVHLSPGAAGFYPESPSSPGGRPRQKGSGGGEKRG